MVNLNASWQSCVPENICERTTKFRLLGSGAHVFELVFEHMEDILNADFSYV